MRVWYVVLSTCMGILILGFSQNFWRNTGDNFQHSGNVIKLVTPTNEKLPFDEEAGVTTLETFLAAVLDQLVYVDDNFRVQSGLLTTYKWEPESKSYLLTLKEGLQFHNGRVATSKDLKFSLVRGFFQPGKNWFSGFFTNIEGIQKIKPGTRYSEKLVTGIDIVDQRSVRVRLRVPNPSFLHSLARSYFSLVPIEELQDDYKKWRHYPVGAGQFKVVEVDPLDNSVILEKVKIAINGPRRIEVSTKVTGKPSLSLAPILNDNDYKVEFLDRSASVTMILFNANHFLGKSLQFRRAIDLAIDRKRLVRNISSYVPVSELLPSHMWGRFGVYEDQNIAEAKKIILKVAGGKQLHIKVPVFNSDISDPRKKWYLLELRKQLQKIGIKVTLFADPTKFYQASDDKYAMRIVSLGADVADPLILFNLFTESSPVMPFGSRDEELKGLISSAETLVTSEDREISIQKLSKYFYDNRISIPLFERKQEVFIRNDFQYKLGKQDSGIPLLVTRFSTKDVE